MAQYVCLVLHVCLSVATKLHQVETTSNVAA